MTPPPDPITEGTLIPLSALRHPFRDETLPFGRVAHAQARMLARHLRGDLDGCPAFVWT